jgi:hypothetical protein
MPAFKPQEELKGVWGQGLREPCRRKGVRITLRSPQRMCAYRRLARRARLKKRLSNVV